MKHKYIVLLYVILYVLYISTLVTHSFICLICISESVPISWFLNSVSLRLFHGTPTIKMKFKYRVFLVGSLLLLSVSTICLWLEYRTLYRKHHTSTEHRFSEEHRSFFKLSNYTSDLVYQPRLRNKPHYRLVVVSLSAAAYYKRRSAVRSTWLTRLKSWNFNRAFDQARAIHFFICFTPRKSRVKDDLKLEAEQYGDIVIFSDQDKYSQLPVQTLTALDWANSQFTFDFLLKTDDDTLVNVDEVS